MNKNSEAMMPARAVALPDSADHRYAFFIVAGYFIAYVLLDWVSYITPQAPFVITPWNPPPGLSVALLVIFGLRYWPALFVAALTAEAVVRGMPHSIIWDMLNAAAMTLGYTLMAMVLKRRLSGGGDIRTLKQLAWFVAVTMLATFPIASVYVAMLSLAGLLPPMGYVINTMMFWVGDVIGVVITTPLLLIVWNALAADKKPKLTLTREIVLQVASVVVTLWIIFGIPNADQSKFFYLLFLPFIWIAMRHGFAGAVIANLCIQLALIGMALRLGHDAVNVLELQALMLALAITGLFLGMAVSERRQALDTLHEREDELRHALRLAAATEMSSAMAHELNQPLTAISNYVQASRTMLSAVDIDRRLLTNTLEKAAAEVTRAGKVMHRLRDFYRGGAVQIESVSIGTLIDNAVSPLSARVSRYRVVLAIIIPQPSPIIHVDPIQIEAVLHNLVANAIDAMVPDNGYSVEKPRRVIIEGVIKQSDLLISVDDSGPGVGPDMGDRVFEAFETSKTEGLGLGLAISRSIVEAHDGRIWLEDSKLGGARFCFTLPLQPVQEGYP